MDDQQQNQPTIDRRDNFLDRDSRNITRELYRRALRETCEYVEKHMLLAPSNFENRYELLDFAIQNVSITDGL